jgi:hypothetical protein
MSYNATSITNDSVYNMPDGVFNPIYIVYVIVASSGVLSNILILIGSNTADQCTHT